MKKLLFILIILFLAACESSTETGLISEFVETPIAEESNQQNDIESTSESDVFDNKMNEEESYDFQLGILSEVLIDSDMISHVSENVIIFNQPESFNKLTYQHILIIYTEETNMSLSDYGVTKSNEGLLKYSMYQGQVIYSLNIGDGSNYQDYLNQIPANLFSTEQVIQLTLSEKNFIESLDGNLRLYNIKLIDDTTSIGVLTGAFPAGSKLSFFPTISHTTYNDKNDLFNGEHNVFVILQESDFDMGVSADTYGINLKKGEVASKQITDFRVIFVRPSSNDRFEIFELTEEIFQIEGQGTFIEFTNLVNRLKEQSTTAVEEVITESSPEPEVELTDLSSIRQPADYCRLRQAPRSSHSQVYGFPIQTMIPHKGDIDVAVVPVDFGDYPGNPDLISKLQFDLPQMTDWSEFYSGGEMVYRVHTTNKWIRAPKEAKYYRSRDGEISEGYQGQDKRILPLLQSQEESVSQLIAASDNFIDWSIIDVVIFIFPVESIEEQTHLYMHMGTFQSPSKGTVRFPVWGENFHELSRFNPNITYWDWSVHEILHWQGLVGHGPLNHSDYSIMTNQYASSAGLHAWEAFLLDWWSDDDFTCINPNDILEPINFQFDSIDVLGSSPGQKSLMLPLNKNEILVMEYRTRGQWSTLESVFEGILIYYIDVNGEFVRCDSCDQLIIEQQNFWRLLRNEEIMPCQTQFVPHCGFPSVVQKPGYELIYENLKFEVLTSNTIQISRIVN